MGSSVIGVRIGGMANGIKLPDPVIINLTLKKIAVSVNMH